MFKYLTGTSGKFIIVIVCISLNFQLRLTYEKVRGTLEGILAKGQVSSDSMTYLWAKLLGDGALINIVSYTLYIIIFCVAIKIGAIIYTNRVAFSALNKITKRNHLF